MANDLSVLLPKIIARGMVSLRKTVLLPTKVNTNYSLEAKQKGDTIDFPLPVAITISDVTPAAVPPTPQSVTPTKASLQLNNWKKGNFHLTDAEMAKIDAEESFLPMEMAEAFAGLAGSINQSIFAEYKGIYGYVGTAATTPFASDITAAINCRKTLNQQLAPQGNRFGLLDYAAEGNALGLAAFRDVSQSGKDKPVIKGELGEFLGIDWAYDDDVPTHTAGTGSGYLINNSGGHAAGVSTVTVDTGTGTILVGDVVTFAGHTQTYAVTAALAANVFTISPALQSAVADNAAVTLKASHVVNLVAHRDAIVFASRPLLDAVSKYGRGQREMYTMPDPKTGIVMRVEVISQYKQTAFEIDCLWGAKLVRPELAVRLAG